MISSSLLTLLKSLDHQQHRELSLWLASPLFNKSEGLLRFYRQLASPLRAGRLLPSRAVVWQAAFPEESLTEKQWNYQVHWLLNQIRDFLAWRAWQSDEQEVIRYQCRSLRQLGQEKLFLKAYRRGLQKLEKAPYRDERYYRQLLQLNTELGRFSTISTSAERIRLFAKNDFLEATIYRFQHLRAKCQPTVETAIAEYREHQPIPAGILIYEALEFAIQNEHDAPPYYSAKALFLEHLPIFQPEEQRTLYLLFINYSIRRMNHGDAPFADEVFEWYQDGLDRGILFENHQLSTSTYKNIVTAGLRLKRLDWTYEFIEKYKQKLPPQDRNLTYLYNLAVYYFSLPDYDKTMELLRDVDWGKDLYAALDARAILLRIYYERNYTEALLSLLDSFQVFLKRNEKQIGYARTHYVNLIKIVRLLLQIKDQPDARPALIQRIRNLNNLAEREWLLGQLESLEG